MVGPADAANPIYATTDGSEPVIETPVEGYKADAKDGDNDGFVQDGTEFERPVGTDLTPEEQIAAVSDAPKPKKTRKARK